MAFAFYLGIDLTDEETGPTATLSLVEKEADDPQDEARYHVRTIERTDHLEGDDPEEEHHAFAGLAERVQDLLVSERQEVGRSVVVVNATGSYGQAMLRAIQARGLSPIGITVTGGEGAAQSGSGLALEGGDTAADDDAGFFVSEAALAGRLTRLEAKGRLIIEQESTRYASDLAHGLHSWRSRVETFETTEEAEDIGEAAFAETEEGGDEEPTDAVPTGETGGQAAREEAHDAFVTSAALACWLGEERSFDPTEHLGGEAPTTGEAKRLNRPDLAD